MTVHYYSPFRFTHQGADWLEEAGGWLGTSWGTEAERARVRADLGRAAAWARAHGRPLFLGEFGMSWAYWDFATEFGAFDVGREAWRAPLRQALLGGS